jgi:hypothetical protein
MALLPWSCADRRDRHLARDALGFEPDAFASRAQLLARLL